MILSESPKSKKTFIGSHGIVKGSTWDVWNTTNSSRSTCPWQRSQLIPLGRERGFWDSILALMRILLATVNAASKVTVLGLKGGKKFEIATGQGQSSVKFSPDGKTLVTAGYGTKAYLWSTGTGELIREFALGPVRWRAHACLQPRRQHSRCWKPELDNWPV